VPDFANSLTHVFKPRQRAEFSMRV